MNDKIHHEKIAFLDEGGQMGKIMRDYPWSDTVLGAAHTWPQSLKSTLSLLLNSQFPMLLYWGPNFYCFLVEPHA